MSTRSFGTLGRSTRIGRRDWLIRLVAGSAFTVSVDVMLRRPALAGETESGGNSTGERDGPAELELRAIREQSTQAGIAPLSTVKSGHYQAIGDASPRFMSTILKDCELLALDYLEHFLDRGFDPKPPGRRLTLVVFSDERPFHRFFPEAARANIVGGYSKEKNWVVLFDWRNVPVRPRSGVANMMTLAHEAMHQLCFNTGLLPREADTPLTIVEGLGVYAETRRLNGRSDLGRLNRSRLDDLAHIRRRLAWISVKELLTVGQSILGRGQDLVDLFYAESWLLVYFLMQDPARLPLFRDYLKAIAVRFDDSHRIDDAETHFGNLDRFDRDLRAFLVRLQTGR